MMAKTIDLRKPQKRIGRLKKEILGESPAVCTERAIIWTDYFKDKKNQKKPLFLQMAEAMRDVLQKKSIAIYEDELIVGNYTSKRVGGNIFPELHGLVVLEDLFRFSKRKINPLRISTREIWQLLKIIPFWSWRFVGIRAHKTVAEKIRLLWEQLGGRFYILNEAGGVAHFSPDYQKLITLGTSGLIREIKGLQEKEETHSEKWFFFEAEKTVAESLASFGERYAHLARKMADEETDHQRKNELIAIAKTCEQVPRYPARSLQEALQSIMFAQIAISLESLDQGITPGRMDQYLYPYYLSDLTKSGFTPEMAKELFSAFCIKTAEIVPVFSERLTEVHGGLFNGQVVTIGGVNKDGNDVVNELSYLILDVMNELRMRQPNFHARIHQGSSEQYITKIMEVLRSGATSPALYNDEIIIKTMQNIGYSLEDARDYTAIGCVELATQGKSFSSTDAALFNMPIILELALNEGKRFGSSFRLGKKTIPVSEMKSMADVLSAFESQLSHRISRLHHDLSAMEIANRRFHPTPLSNLFLEGCLKSGQCSTAGGTKYNFSGVQCVGPTDTGDSLYAIEKAVFIDKKLSLKKLHSLLKNNFSGSDGLYWRGYLRNLGKFGNDEPEVDRYTAYVIELFKRKLSEKISTRNGQYTVGLYSVTVHNGFGKKTGALPNGRLAGEPFASGICPGNGLDRKGPTALLNSLNRLDFTKTANGINFNMKFDVNSLRGEEGAAGLKTLIKTYFKRGGMQAQVNVLDAAVLKAAKENPALYPNLLIRVSGYSAYFNDLSPEMKEEVIKRTTFNSC